MLRITIIFLLFEIVKNFLLLLLSGDQLEIMERY